MTDCSHITHLAKQLQAGKDQAAGEIWAAYVDKLLRLVGRRLDRGIHRRADPEDVLQSAFQSFCRAAKKGNYTLESRADLWDLLCTITIRKVINTVQRNSRRRRDYRRDESLQPSPGPASLADRDGIAASGPTPLDAAIFKEEFQRLLGVLSKEELPNIVCMKFDGMTNAEIATALNCTERTIERKVGRIREEWIAAGLAE